MNAVTCPETIDLTDPIAVTLPSTDPIAVTLPSARERIRLLCLSLRSKVLYNAPDWVPSIVYPFLVPVYRVASRENHATPAGILVSYLVVD
jgi:hypothetical protein|uniref:Uncharacterized protein n=2 Tax=Picea TaxID=3328 RepID=A0A101M1F8_PICGL|nr:hypothetical protein ABT39_MTgene3835 [Picea glauca]QHR90167.1 hypothetical protein Q903MT_gene4190 [Picea sitchensis]